MAVINKSELFALVVADDPSWRELVNSLWNMTCLNEDDKRRIRVLSTGGAGAAGMAWSLGTVYSEGDIVSHDGVVYVAIADNTADAANEPGVGVDTDTYWVSAVAGLGSPSWNNQGMPGLLAVAQGDPVCNIAITAIPLGRVDAFVNSQRWLVGNADKTLDCYFSADLGVTARDYADVTQGDKLYLGTTGAAVGVTTADLVSFCYNA